MAFGAQIFGSDGKLQIDETFFNLSLKGSGTATANIGYGDFNKLYNLVVTGATMPLVALRVTRNPANPNQGRGATIIQTTRSGNTWTFTILVYNNLQNDYSFQYWVYDKPPAGIPTGWGIWLGNGPGNTNFLNGSPILDFSAGTTHAFLAASGVDYQENYVFDTNTLQDIYYYSYTANIYWCWEGSGGQATGAGTQIIGGAQYGQPPNYGYESAGGGGNDFIQVNVTGQ